MSTASWVRCAGCGAAPAPGDPYEWACPEVRPGDDVDHVMVRHLDLSGLRLVTSVSDNPFVRYRSLLHAYHRWLDAGRDDASFVELVEGLDAAVVSIEGRGFRRTPLSRHPSLDAATGARVWVKDETGNVSGSHKGRHLFGLTILLRVVERLGLLTSEQRSAPLAIASCGNAALAAAVVAAAAGRPLQVFIPPDADPAVVVRLDDLGAELVVCERDGSSVGDPCYARFRDAVAAGAIPFGCQGTDNGLTIEGGATLAWETAETLAEAGVARARFVVQVGGGALASACAQGMDEALALGALAHLPTLDTVQTEGCYPLARAYARVVDRIDQANCPDAVLSSARHRRSLYMWPWDSTPGSVAHGILDDETYDWAAVVGAMIRTGGSVLVVDEPTLREANEVARRTTGIDVDHTGSAGLAGLLKLSRSGGLAADSDVVVIFSGKRR